MRGHLPGVLLALGLALAAQAGSSTRASWSLRAAPGLECQAYLDGQVLNGGTAELHEGLNVVTVIARGAHGWVEPSLRVGAQEFPADARWFATASPPPAGWQSRCADPGFAPAVSSGEGLWAPAPAASTVYLRRGIYVAAPGPGLFPPGSAVWMPAGTRQRVKPYLACPAGLDRADYRLYLTTPSWMRFEAADATEGFRPDSVLPVGTERRDGRDYTTYRATYATFPSGALELTLRWLYDDGTTLGYQPCIRAGGSFDWRRLSAAVTVPPRAAAVHPLVRKLGGLGITGSFWVDNLTVHEGRSGHERVKTGDFEATAGADAHVVAGEGVGGSRCLRVDCAPDRVGMQDAIWVPAQPLEVQPGSELLVALDAKAEKLVQPGEAPLASLLFAADREVRPGDDTLWLHVETNGGNVTEVERALPVHALPRLLDVRPRQIRIIPCYVTDCFSEPVISAAVAENLWRAGMSLTWGSADNQVVEILRRRHGVETILTLHNCTAWQWPPSLGSPSQRQPEWAATEYPDQPSSATMCPTWALTEGEAALAAVETWVAANLRRTHYVGVDWDLEQSIVDPPTFCFCRRCLAAFAGEAGLADAGTLTPQRVVAEYREPWTTFRLRQNAQLVARVRRAVKSVDPQLPFDVYSAVQSTYGRERCGVDWALLAPALDLAMAGGTREELRATRAALGSVPLLGYECYYASHLTEAGPAPDPRSWRNRLLQQCVESGGRGVLIWSLAALDGGAFYGTSEAAAVLARHEDVIYNGRRCDEDVVVAGLPASAWSALRYGRERLVMLLNSTDQPAVATVTLPAPWRRPAIADPVTGRAAEGSVAGSILCPLPPFAVRVVRARAP